MQTDASCGPTDRKVVANIADAGGVLKADGALFKGEIAPEVPLANTPIEWSGTRWTELMAPLHSKGPSRNNEGDLWRQVLIAHELFHRIQPELSLERPEGGNHHLDTLQGRYLIQLGWRALARGLGAKSAVERKAALVDALLFRAERFRLFPTRRRKNMPWRSTKAFQNTPG